MSQQDPREIYISVKTGKIYRLNADESAIDLEHPIADIDLKKYNWVDTNDFLVYELKKQYR